MSPAVRLRILAEALAGRCARYQAHGLAAFAIACRGVALAVLVALVVVSCESDNITAPPPSPNLTTPVSGQLLDNGCPQCSDPMTWDFKWVDVPDATQYHLYVIAETATLPVIDQHAIPFSQYHRETQGYATPGVWKWRVRVLVKGKWSGWSEERTFEVESPCLDCPADLPPAPLER